MMSSVTGVSTDTTSSLLPSATTSQVDQAQNTFLKLLVTQMQNQDPLNPMDNAQVTSQMAQLSTVSGINKLNDTMNALMTSYGTSQSLQAASMIGHQVLVPGSDINLSNGQAVAGVSLDNPADQVTITIKDGAGNVVDTESLGAQQAGVLNFAWDGTTAGGSTAPDGAYTFDVSAIQGGSSVNAQSLSYGQVGSITLGSTGTLVNVMGLGSVDMSQVKQII
jgi:flagellar basal-body rod modification protein FlgD